MSLRDVVERMVVDEEFKGAILENPEETLSAGGFEVSEEELEALKNLTAEDLEGVTLETLDERLSMKTTVYTENIQD